GEPATRLQLTIKDTTQRAFPFSASSFVLPVCAVDKLQPLSCFHRGSCCTSGANPFCSYLKSEQYTLHTCASAPATHLITGRPLQLRWKPTRRSASLARKRLRVPAFSLSAATRLRWDGASGVS